MSDWIDYKSLRAQLSFIDVLRHYGVQARIKGDRATALCPLPGHPARTGDGKRTPSLSIQLTRKIFQCFGCKASGNVLDFCIRMEGADSGDPNQFRGAAAKVAQAFGLSRGEPRSVRSDADRREANSVTPTATSQRPVSDVVVNPPLDFELKHLDSGHAYLLDRGLAPETIARFGLGFCHKGMMKNRIAIPLHDSGGQLIGYAGRLVDEDQIGGEVPKYLFPGSRERDGKRLEFHKSAFLYNGHRIERPVRELIVVEGFTSVWWVHQHGIHNVVALMGSSASSEQCALLCDLLRPEGRLWVMPDGDAAGQEFALSVLAQVSPFRWVRWVKLEVGQPTDLTAKELSALLR